MNSISNVVISDLASSTVRELNQSLHDAAKAGAPSQWRVLNPRGTHSIAAGLNAPFHVQIEGHAGYYAAGMNQLARIEILGNAGQGVAENMMSGEVWVRGDAAQAAGATARGGFLVVEGNAGARCGISMKGADIVVKGSVGHMSAFMGQRGALVVCGDAGESLGDSLYEAKLFVRGTVKSLGADCEKKEMSAEDVALLSDLLSRAEVSSEITPEQFTLYGSARNLYHFHVDNVSAY